MSEQQHRSFSDAIERLYAAALDPGVWRDFLGTTASMFSAGNAYVSQIEHDRRTLDYVALHPMDWDPAAVERYTALMDEDPRMPIFRSSPGRPMHCRMAVPEKRLRGSRTYNEALDPLNIEYTMLVGLPERLGVTNYLGFTRDRTDDPFDSADCALLNEFVPHLMRAFDIRRMLRQPELPKTTAELILDRLPHGVLIADRQGKVLEINTAARNLLASGRGLRLLNDRLRTDHEADQHRLDTALAAISVDCTTVKAAQTILLRAKGSQIPLTLIINALARDVHRPNVGPAVENLALVTIPSAQRRSEDDENIIRQSFGLSPTQTRLTALLMSGHSLKEAAGQLGIAESTARQYLKIVFSKIGARRQADLIRVVGNALILRG